MSDNKMRLASDDSVLTCVKKYLAEFLGTGALVVFGCGTAAQVGCNAFLGSGYILTALAFGLVIVAMAYSIGNVSGCHVNPAVSLAMLICGKLSFTDFIGYISAQFSGGIVGAFMLRVIFNQNESLGANALYKGSWKRSFLIEVALTFIFVFVILWVTSKLEYSKIAGIVIGLTLTLVHILGISLTGTSVNPARSLGPALFVKNSQALQDVWVFIAAPLVGAVIAALIFIFFKSGQDKKSDDPEDGINQG